MVRRVFFLDEETKKGLSFDIDLACTAPGASDATTKPLIVTAVLTTTRGMATVHTTEKLFISRTTQDGGWFWMETEPSSILQNDVVVIAKETLS